MPKRREYKQMSLADAVKSQESKFPTTKCYECDGVKKLISKPLVLHGITVWDFPQYKCECGATSHRLSVAIAVENLQEKFKLHGGYNLQDLLEIEKHNGLQ